VTLSTAMDRANAAVARANLSAMPRTNPLADCPVASLPSLGPSDKIPAVLIPEPPQQHQRQEDAARWRAIVESAVDAIIVIDRRGRIESFNPAAERMFGYPASEVLGQNVSILMPAPHAGQHDGYIDRYIATGIPRIIGIGRDIDGRRKDGSIFPGHLSVGEISNEGERKFTGIVRDLTDRVNLEKQLREEAGLARIGELAAVLAHEVKNPLAAVSGAMQILAQKLASREDREIVDEALSRLDALSAMMTDLLLFARPPKPRLAAVDVTGLVESLVSFLRMDAAWHTATCRVEGHASMVLADAELLKVALQNLLLNALQAMDGRGQLTVTMHHADGMVHIDVADSGAGIAPDVQPRLFTPFFTTKARGTGLGLATVRRIAGAHRGEITVIATGPSGTTMRLSLPASGQTPIRR
jgi:PAS domain S-box-containing protein